MVSNGSAGFYEWHKLMLMLTNRCNLTCKMCDIITHPKNSLPREIAFQAADFAEKHGLKEFEIGGGEATLVPYFWEFLDRVCQLPAEVRVVTNGVKTTDEQVQTFASYPNLQVQISIDGVGEVHDTIRGAHGAFERSAHTLERLAKAGVRYLSINSVVQRSNYHNMVDTYEAFKHLPLRYHAFSLIESGNASDPELIPPEKWLEVLEVLHELRRRARRDGRDVILSHAVIAAFGQRVLYPQFAAHPGLGCTVVRRSIIIDQYGYVFPCFHYSWNKGPKRNLHEQSLEEILNDPEVLEEHRRAIGPGGCSGCSTMCYNWDPTFRQKVMALRMRKMVMLGKEYLRGNHPAVFAAAKKLRGTLLPR